MKLLYAKFLLFVFVFFGLSNGFCEVKNPNERPKIGIALAGGSAYGLAHIGVLAWLEEHHIPVDAISGTSMGGLVAGFYAAGQSPRQMRDLLNALDWNEALRSEPPFQALPFRRKEDERSVPSRLEIGFKNGFNLPGGLNPAQPINMLLSRTTLPYSTTNNFDDLPIPFRAMAVDLQKGERVVLKDGSLASALRATMAIPGVFTPVEKNGKVLIDGGLLNNVPTEALQELAPDITIAVDIHASVSDVPRLQSLIDILGRSEAIAIYDNERRSLALADIIIAPDLTGLSSFDFANVNAFYERGYQAAEKKKAILLKFAADDAQWQQYLSWRQTRLRTTTPAETVSVSGTAPEKAETLVQRLQPFAGVDLSVARGAKLEETLTAITGEGRYESFLYSLQKQDERTVLSIIANEKKHGPPFVRLGFEVNGADPQNLGFNLLSRVVGLDVGKPGAETRTDLRLGSTRQATFEYYRPLTHRSKSWFVAPHVFYLDENRQFSQNGTRLAIYGEQKVGGGLDLGRPTGRSSELRLGVETGHQLNALRTGNPAFPLVEGTYSAARVRWSFDGQDSAVLPTRGTRTSLESRYVFQAPGTMQGFTQAEIRVSSYFPIAQRHTAFGTLSAGTTFGKTAAPLQQFTLGGPLRLGAYNLDEFRGDDYILLSTGYLHRIGQLPPFLGGKIMAGGWYEFGGAFDNVGPKNYYNSLSAGLAAETAIGPFFIGNSFGEAGRKRFFFAIGRLF